MNVSPGFASVALPLRVTSELRYWFGGEADALAFVVAGAWLGLPASLLVLVVTTALFSLGRSRGVYAPLLPTFGFALALVVCALHAAPAAVAPLQTPFVLPLPGS